MLMAPAKHFLAQIEQPMHSAGVGMRQTFFIQVDRQVRTAGTVTAGNAQDADWRPRSSLTGVSAMKSVIGCGWAMPINSFIERDTAFLHQEERVPDSRSWMMP